MLRERTINISNSGSRKQVRDAVIQEFLKEEPGSGTGELTSKYTYFVETLDDGRRVLLTRPAILNKGFDFIIRVEGVNFGEGKGKFRDNPTLNDIVEDLEGKKTANPVLYRRLFELIQKIYECKQISLAEYTESDFGIGYPVEIVLKIVKWFFIEQDIRYWNWSGRGMLMSKVPVPE